MLFEAWSGMVGPNRFAYYRRIDGKDIRIPDEEVEQFMAPFHEKLALHEGANCAEYMRYFAELTFLPLYERAVPNADYVLSWTHSKNYKDTLQVISVTDKEVSFVWCENRGEAELTIEAVATASENYAFEADGIRGRLAFGTRCVWVLVEESESEAIPVGAYLYDVFTKVN